MKIRELMSELMLLDQEMDVTQTVGVRYMPISKVAVVNAVQIMDGSIWKDGMSFVEKTNPREVKVLVLRCDFLHYGD